MTKHITGQITRLEMKRGFAIVATNEGDIFVHSKSAGGKWQYFTDYASVKVEYTTEYNSRAKNDDDLYRQVATRVISVENPEEFEVLTKVAYFDLAKGFGRVSVGDSFTHDSAFLSGKVCEAAGVGRPGPGMPIRAIVIEGPKGPVVTSFEWGPKIGAEYAAKNQLDSEEAELKFFNRRKSFGFLVLADGTELHFHIKGVAQALADRFYDDKRFTAGARFRFVRVEHHGKSTANIVELLELAPEPDAEVVETTESVEVVAIEASAPVEDVVTATAAESEAKPAKAPRKKAATKPKAEAKPKADKAATPKKTSAKKSTKAAEAPADESADIASMAKSACANGGGDLAQAFLAAAVPAGNA